MEWLLLAVSLALVAACGLFVAAEFALVTVDRAEVERAASGGDRGAQGVSTALRSLSTQLSSAQVGITLTNLAIGFLAEPAISKLVEDPLGALGVPDGAISPTSVALGLVLATFATMIFGELVPKNVAIALPLATAKATQAALRGFTAAMSLPIRLLNGSANTLIRSLGVEPQEELRSARSAEELSSLAGRSASEGTLDTETAHLVQRSIAFGPRTAGEIMTPRMRMAVVDITDPVSDIIELSAATGFSKFPVTKGSTDNIVGSVHVKQAVAVARQDRRSTKVREVMVPATVVPESLRLDPLLALLRGEGFQMAIVSDEYGGTAGVVTLEDVVEEIVGDIADEHDRIGARLRRRPDGSWIVSGLLRPDEVEDATGLALPEHEDYDTVAGLLVQALGRIPARGDEVVVPLPVLPSEDDDDEPIQEYVALRVELMDGRRVDRISLRLQHADREDEA
ncbi:HlyC/CorC family transporter [Nocardioides marmoriginsengisoli]|uniref:HlyC/CorC family transporter n=1 Tax=Nocardioides marmoriginsengisoli TaxID=661483 RepID=A0A3N0CLR0_9ACTN|nr:hemolysin family protein [Nocardioides marmoriginsengisoli]RNL64372.1 HlyC/CorC family transporter [Nocardioides marmoriginsengisoli]